MLRSILTGSSLKMVSSLVGLQGSSAACTGMNCYTIKFVPVTNSNPESPPKNQTQYKHYYSRLSIRLCARWRCRFGSKIPLAFRTGESVKVASSQVWSPDVKCVVWSSVELPLDVKWSLACCNLYKSLYTLRVWATKQLRAKQPKPQTPAITRKVDLVQNTEL
jgi:hypothetical protein